LTLRAPRPMQRSPDGFDEAIGIIHMVG
jgi:hypothetical protein